MEQIKIVVIGSPGVGKTSLIKQYIDEGTFDVAEVTDQKTELYMKKIHLDGKYMILQIWDYQPKIQKMKLGPLTRGTSACLLLYSIDNSNSFKEIE